MIICRKYPIFVMRNGNIPLMKLKPSIQSPVVLSRDIVSRNTTSGIAIDYFNIVLCQSGEAHLNVNLEPVKEVPGTVVVFFPGDVIKVDSMSDNFKLESLMCSTDIWHDAAASANEDHLNYLHRHFYMNHPVATTIVQRTFHLLDVIVKEYPLSHIRSITILQLKSLLSSYVLYLMNHPSDIRIQSSRSDDLFNTFKYHLGKHYRTSRDVGFYAENMHITPKNLTTIVKAKTGITAKAAIDEYTIMQLKLVLRNSTQSIKEIAWEFSFSSLPFFCEYFRRHTGMTPQQWREG